MSNNELKIKDIEGVGPTTEKKLRDAGYYSIESIAVSPVKELMQKANLTNEMATKVTEVARKMSKIDFISAKELWEKRASMKKISTGLEELNNLLGGGIETSAITEFWGEYATGKTQLCMKLCVAVQQSVKKGGLNANALYIDTEGTFSPMRVNQMSEVAGLNPEETLKNITYARCYNSDHQILIVDNAFKLCNEKNIKLVIIDSITSHWRADYMGRENLSERQQKLNMHLHKMLRLAEVEDLAIVVTNQVQANPAVFFGDPNRPAGGHVLSHATTHRILLRKGKKGSRVAKITDSPCLPSDIEALFMITGNGLEEAELK